MGLHSSPWSELCERRCRDDAFRNQMRLGREADEARLRSESEAAPQALQAQTADAATSTVETGVARGGIAARAFAALSRLRSGNGSER